jgi:hypothetical protein
LEIIKKKFQTGECKKLHTEELHNLYSSASIFMANREDEVSGAYSTHGRSDIFVRNVRRKAPHEEI